MTSPYRLVIDCDVGNDDAQAIMLALVSGRTTIEAITTVEGNTTMEKVTHNTLRLLNMCKRTEIPVYKGCCRSLMGKVSPDTSFHGADGLGDVAEDIYPPDMSALRDKHAVLQMIDMVNTSPGELTLIALGPLTNVALALRMDQEFCKKLKALHIMGGSMAARGNVAVCNEFNFYCDPEAVHVVLKDSGIIPFLVTIEPCLEYKISWETYDRLCTLDTEYARFINATEKAICKNQKAFGMNGYVTFDQIAMATLINPEIIEETKELYVTIELEGKYARGQMVVDWLNHLGEKPNIRLLTALNYQEYLKMIKEMFEYQH